MAKLRVHCFSTTLDGFSAGPDQDLANPAGVGFMPAFGWQFATQSGHQMMGKEGGGTGVDDDFVKRGFEGIGAWILGRNMFGPVRGPWPDESWRGWWGENPVYHVPVFVLTHHARKPLEMKGGTTFHFVTEGIDAALERAMEAAGGKDVRVGGGASTIRQYLRAGLVDEMHTAVSPVLLGRGERVWDGLDVAAAGYECSGKTAGENATHYLLRRAGISR
jgi:dihydrofolate reductase